MAASVAAVQMMSGTPKSDEHTVLINPYGDINGAADTSDQQRVMRRDTSIMVRARQEQDEPVPTQPYGQTGNPNGDDTVLAQREEEPDDPNEGGAGGKPADPVPGGAEEEPANGAGAAPGQTTKPNEGATNGVVESNNKDVVESTNKEEHDPSTLAKKDPNEGATNDVVESTNKEEHDPSTLAKKDPDEGVEEPAAKYVREDKISGHIDMVASEEVRELLCSNFTAAPNDQNAQTKLQQRFCYEIGLRAGLNPSPDHFDNIRCDFEAIDEVSLLETAAALEEKAAVELHIVYRGLQPGNRGVRIHYKLGVWDVHSFNTTLDKLHTFNETHLLEDVCDDGAIGLFNPVGGCPLAPTDNFLTSLTVDKINKDDAPEDGGDLNVPAQLDAEHRVSGFAGEVGLENALSTTDEPEKSTKIVEDVNEIGFNPARMGAVQSASLGFILQTLLVGFAIIRATSTVL